MTEEKAKALNAIAKAALKEEPTLYFASEENRLMAERSLLQVIYFVP